jgi:glycosyltransferase involved in cell wall biosynthesis
MARVLYLTNVLPYPLDAGAKIRAYYVLRHLARSHELTLVSFVRASDRPAYVSHLREFCREVHTVPMQRSRTRDLYALAVSLWGGQPALILRDDVAQMRGILDWLVREQPYDVVHADQASMAQYALYARTCAHGGSYRKAPRLVLDAHNALYRIPERLARHERNPVKRWLLQREARALARYEGDVYRRFDELVFVTDVDRETLQQQGVERGQAAGPRLTTIPICIDPGEKPLVARDVNAQAITHVGNMLWPPNAEGMLWFARQVFPSVLAEVPGTRLVIVGKDPPAEIAGLAAEFPAANVEVTGYVEDPEPYLAATGVFIVPLHAGGGMRVKIVDAWCWGLPIVSTSIGAEGIDVRDGENILIADGADAFARAVVRILKDPSLGERLARGGRQWVEERYDWRRVYARWDAVYGRLVPAAGEARADQEQIGG